MLVIFFVNIFCFLSSAQSPYVLTYEDVDLQDGILEEFRYSGEGNDPEWVVIPDDMNVTEITFFGFHDKEKYGGGTLKRVTLPSTLRRISDGAFANCKLEYVDFNEQLEFIGYQAFARNKLQSVLLPEKLSVCCNCAFSGNPIVEIRWPTVPISRISGFDYILTLRNVEIPANVKSIGSGAFGGTPLESLHFNEGLDSICANAFLYSQSYGTKVDFSLFNQLDFPNSLSYIGPGAFAGQVNLSEINFGNSLRKIDRAAFRGCGKLQGVLLPESLDSLGNLAFSECSNLTSIVFNDNLKFIGNYAFDNCKNLSNYRLPEYLSYLGEYAFSRTLIDDLYIPGSLKKVRHHTFSYCSYTPSATITFADGIEEICDSAFYRIVRITEDSDFSDSVSVVFPNTLKRIGNSAFEMVWVKQTRLPERDSNGNRLRWDAYLKGVLDESDVKYIGGFMRTGFQRAALYEYVASVVDDEPVASMQTLKKERVKVRIIDIYGRPVPSHYASTSNLPYGLYVRIADDGSAALIIGGKR